MARALFATALVIVTACTESEISAPNIFRSELSLMTCSQLNAELRLLSAEIQTYNIPEPTDSQSFTPTNTGSIYNTYNNISPVPNYAVNTVNPMESAANGYAQGAAIRRSRELSRLRNRLSVLRGVMVEKDC